MNTGSSAVRDAETETEQLQRELERLRCELDRCTTRLHLTEKLLEHVADAVFVADVDGRIIDVNPAACSLLGYEREELVKMRPWDFATRASWEGILGLIGTMPLGDPITVRRAYRCKNGEQKTVEVRLTRENHAGRDLIVAFSRDVADQKSSGSRKPGAHRWMSRSGQESKRHCGSARSTFDSLLIRFQPSPGVAGLMAPMNS
jgi:PAS domain S-box-containing protein